MSLAHLSHRSVVKMSGPDVQEFLQGQLTNDIAGLTPQTPLYAGVLSPQGKAMFAIFLFQQGDDIRIDCATEQADALVRRFTMFRLRRKFDIAPAPELAVYAQWDEPLAHPADPRLADAGSRFVAPASSQTTSATLADWHAHRLPLGLPEADEIGDADLMWLETNGRELHGTSFTKGCYTGQENVARMHHRDKLRKRLLPVCIAGNAEGPIMSGPRQAGELRGQRHGDLQMALLRTERLADQLTIGDAAIEYIRPPWLENDAG